MQKVVGLLVGLLSVSACVSDSLLASTDVPLHPFIGCWESESGLSREGWTIDPSGWLVGYSANRGADNAVTFFEFMRVERQEGAPDVLVVSGADGSTVRFVREMAGEGVFKYVNVAHDYPQVITYRPTPGRLDADISLLDGSQKTAFPKAACAGP